MPILKVPYFVQPENNLCQSSCMKMIMEYYTGSQWEKRPIQEIYDEINNIKGHLVKKLGNDPRPVKKGKKNQHQNFVWWLNKEMNISDKNKQWKTLPSSKIGRANNATKIIVEKIDNGIPVIISLAKGHDEGHIVLVVGYEKFELKDNKNNKFSIHAFICHDPYGNQSRPKHWGFHFASLKNGKLFVKRTGRFSMTTSKYDFPGEDGPGKGVIYFHRDLDKTFNEEYEKFRQEINSRDLTPEEIAQRQHEYRKEKFGPFKFIVGNIPRPVSPPEEKNSQNNSKSEKLKFLNPLTGLPIISLNEIRSNEYRPKIGMFGIKRKQTRKKKSVVHNGIDILVQNEGDVYASAKGRVLKAVFNKHLGNTIVLGHVDNFATLYGHLETINVRPKEQIEEGEFIGVAGSTGKLFPKRMPETEKHLHFEISLKNKPQNPLDYITLI